MEKIYQWAEETLGEKIDADQEANILLPLETNLVEYSKNLVENLKEEELTDLQQLLKTPDDSDDDDDVDVDVDHLNLSTLTFDHPHEFESEFLSAEDIINRPEWNATREKLFQMLTGSPNDAVSALQFYYRLLTHHSSPRTVCEAFTSLIESVSNLVELANRIEDEETYEIHNSTLGKKTKTKFGPRGFRDKNLQTALIKSHYLLIEIQKAMPELWLRFNERRLTEIISSFISLLARSFSLDSNLVTSFDIASVLGPNAFWCKHWCYGATGRSLVCSVLRRKKRFFHGLLEILVGHLLNKKSNHSYVWLMDIAGAKLQKARFIQAFSIVAYILSCRAGRALFPVFLTVRKRPWTVSDMISTMLDFILITKNSQNSSIAYKQHFTELGNVLETIQKETTPRTARSYK